MHKLFTAKDLESFQAQSWGILIAIVYMVKKRAPGGMSIDSDFSLSPSLGHISQCPSLSSP